jgi:hypothetical protein
MGRALLQRLFLGALAVALAGCPQVGGGDGGTGADSGSKPPPPSCDSPEDCKLAGYDGVCRATECLSDVPCGDDVECGLGERCVAGLCRFTGCVEDQDCGSGRCRGESFACAECGRSSDCPADRPVCDVLSNSCVQCSSDLECPAPGPAHCNRAAGACVFCLEDKHCPNGLACGPNGVCRGAARGVACDVGVSCNVGLACIQINGVSQCLETCSLYRSAQCPAGETCYKLTFTDTASLVFEQGEPVGVCYGAQSGFRNVNELCTRTAAGSNCQPNLECVPESATASRCRRFCDPGSSLGCVAPDQCHPFVGDYWSNRYGLCYPDNGYGAACTGEAGCRAALACMPFDDPSESDLLSPVCQFAIGPQPALAPCAPQPLPDGGALSDDRQCRSGACVTDPLAGTRDFFCFGACATDTDCSIGGRQGYCDTLFDFPAIGGFTGTLRGCRPTCADEPGCAEYDGGYTCRTRLVQGTAAAVKTTCGNPLGPKRAGEECVNNTECRSGFCHLTDSRGGVRYGVCSEACNDAADCTAAVVDGGLPDGGRTALLSCVTSTLLGFRGFDNVPGTTDDRYVTASLCLGAACASDEACGDVDAGVFSQKCVPEYAPATPGTGYELRCRGASTSGTLEAPTPCVTDNQCVSGVCGTLQAPSTGSGKTCFRACDGNSACPAGTQCRDGALRVDLALGGFQALRSCTP